MRKRIAAAVAGIAALVATVIVAAPAQGSTGAVVTLPGLPAASNNGTGNWYWAKSCSVFGTGGATNLSVTNYDYGSGRQQYHIDGDAGHASWYYIRFDGVRMGYFNDFYVTPPDRTSHRIQLVTSLGNCTVYG